jgi:SAM-dependent methyltransferase
LEDYVYPHMYRVEKSHWWFVARQEILLRYIRDRLALPDGARVLDVGCGTGAILELFSRQFDAYGSDTAPQAIEFCRQRGLTKLHLGGLDTYPASTPFDLITMLDVVEHVEDDRTLLRVAHRLLGERGHLLIAVPAYPSLWSKHDEMLHHKRRYTKESLRRTVTGSGFSITHLTFFNSFLFPVAWAKRIGARVTGSDRANDLEVPGSAVNATLRAVFALERVVLSRGSFPIGLSLLCLASKGPL